MRLLLDTHVLIWWLTDAPDLPPHLHQAIKARENEVYVSVIPSC